MQHLAVANRAGKTKLSIETMKQRPRRKVDLFIAPDPVPARSSASSSSGRPRAVTKGRAVTLKILMNREAEVRKQIQEKYPKLKVPAPLFYPVLIVRLPLRKSYARCKKLVAQKLRRSAVEVHTIL